MPLKGILFDKDGTLVDFDRTWGPAAYQVMLEMTGGDRRCSARLAEVNHFDRRREALAPHLADDRRLLRELRPSLGRGAGPAERRRRCTAR